MLDACQAEVPKPFIGKLSTLSGAFEILIFAAALDS
jgi:hypothetical protein